MIALYVPGSGLLHRVPAGIKLAVLAAFALALSLAPVGPIGTAVVLLVVSALYPLASLRWRMLFGAWWRLRWLVLLLGIALWIFTSPTVAVVNTGRIVALLLVADLVTRTTRMGDLLEVLRRALGPLRRIGADPEAIAMTLSLTIAMVPVIAGFLTQLREAQRARGVRLGAKGALPLLVMTMRHADEVGDALVARGIVR